MSFLNAQSATLAVSLHCVFAQKYRVSITVNCIIRKIRNIILSILIGLPFCKIFKLLGLTPNRYASSVKDDNI